MNVFDVVLIGIALSADAMSVTICNTIANPQMKRLQAWSIPLAFGFFQGLMPVIGYFAGSFASQIIKAYAGVVAFIILGIIGSKMIRGGIKATGDVEDVRGFGLSMLLMQSIATSIDALAVGISFVSSSTPILVAASIIALCTFALCAAMLFAGRKVGALLGERSQIIGGVILVVIGVKELLF